MERLLDEVFLMLGFAMVYFYKQELMPSKSA